MDSVARAAAHFGFRVNPFSRLFTIILVTPPIQGDDESYLTTIGSQPLEIVVMLLFYPVKEGDNLATCAVLINAERAITEPVRDLVL